LVKCWSERSELLSGNKLVQGRALSEYYLLVMVVGDVFRSATTGLSGTANMPYVLYRCWTLSVASPTTRSSIIHATCCYSTTAATCSTSVTTNQHSYNTRSNISCCHCLSSLHSLCCICITAEASMLGGMTHVASLKFLGEEIAWNSVQC